MTSDEDSDGKGLATTTGCCRIRVANDELRPLQIFFVVDFGAHQVLHTHWIDDERYATVLDLAIPVLDILIECELKQVIANSAVQTYTQVYYSTYSILQKCQKLRLIYLLS